MSDGAATTVLLLGLGGNVSQGILKALRMASVPFRVAGACVSATSAGLWAADTARLSPPADDPGFTDWLVAACLEEGARAVLSGVEPVLARMARDRAHIEAETGARVLVAAPEQLAIASDKLATCVWLRDRGLPHPDFAAGADAGDVADLVARRGLPLVAKPRRGRGAQGVVVLRDDRDVAWVTGRDDMVVQELLGDERAEYTAACVGDRDGRVRGCIVMRRRLTAGTTTAIEVDGDAGRRAAAVAVAS
ncbi:MAG TPA: hypothetical protein VFO60_11005, partial [Candidatus Dormibacteraeota bacterium]|nr:hypothetical protein [Candidatus Dormibacteraeota bacterium]